MFALNAPSGIVYTRDGEFRISKSNQIETADGWKSSYTLRNVLDKGNPITVDPTQPIDILKDGTVQQPARPSARSKIGSPDVNPLRAQQTRQQLFHDVAAKRRSPRPRRGPKFSRDSSSKSNVPVSESAVKLVGIMRQFEMLQKAISVGTDMSKQRSNRSPRSLDDERNL